ncbi:MAG: flagellar motor protein MotA [Candidatus Marinimicrobia bacterium]|jgi:chemotaxis protein MotA|nr:flagellar motor protein MotA [Candidatus Neomarinimicrobiota bacterium]MBT4360829.1 flagellar motor protein MotA [Candidatus Neomarinimicrobiota bacterium]MBT4715087.1 flagellar motor protein MotA [Candidatus Neomarinimicrobiota bacterium]MBT4945796.1 flagellar motor protein MotA [Candidatus Neomarinimicrobiota bacterium]MBT5271097.1 flagellar motor protein MotA [Candidatus Neomarinimicrobiota bacterium]
MDIATIIGLIFGLFLVFYGMSEPGTFTPPDTFFNLRGLAIVLGGTFAATLVNYPFKNVVGMLKVSLQAFSNGTAFNHMEVIDELATYSEQARKKGLPSLETFLEGIDNHYLQMGLENAILERDPKKLENFLNNELNSMIDRHTNGQEIFYNMGSYAPAFGLLGTVMGLILMMTRQAATSTVDSYATGAQDSMSALLQGMGIALVTTFYGVLLANLLFIPIAGKLKARSDAEVHGLNIIKAGILSIHSKEHPLIMREKLLTFVDKDTRKAARQTTD